MPSPFCPDCRKPIDRESPLGLCPECLLAAGFSSKEQAGRTDTPPIGAPLSAEQLQKQLPHLKIVELVGRGGMGAVYKAVQPTLNRVVALKLLVRHDSGGLAFGERFRREAQALAQLNHPNIITVYDFGESGPHYFLLMEFVDGLNLRQLQRTQRLAPGEALRVIRDICEALQYAHQQGIVHRDIKPENILIDRSGRVKIADFGIAKMLGEEEGPPITRENQVMGTPYYMAPEQLQNSGMVDQRADIYSLGVVFYELLTGELPVGRFDPPSRRVEIDVRLDEVVLRALERSPEKRYQQAVELKTNVEAVQTSWAAGHSPLAPATEPARKSWLPRPTFSYSKQIFLLPLAMMIGGGTYIMTQSEKAPLEPPLITNLPPARVKHAQEQSPPAGERLSSDSEEFAGVSAEARSAAGDHNQRYWLIGQQPTESRKEPQPLLVVLPGGDGGEDFHPFVKRIYQHSLPRNYLVAQLIAPEWEEGQFEQLVWPTSGTPYPAMKFTTEDFVRNVVEDIQKLRRVDRNRIFTLSWSSGGPAGYAVAVAPDSPVTGSMIAMSVFKPRQLRSLETARGKCFYLLHSPDDFVPMGMPEEARDLLTQAGAAVRLETYAGGHGWHGDVFGNIRAGIRWLEAQRTSSEHQQAHDY